MIDGYGRTIDYVRISVTDRCNLRCVYCMPEEGVGSISHEEILRFGEIERVCQILAENGIQKIKLTGGEPLVRRKMCIRDRVQGERRVTIEERFAAKREKFKDNPEALAGVERRYQLAKRAEALL